MSDFKYKAFISYAHADEAWATWLHKSLERYRIPKALKKSHNLPSNRLVPVFRDRDELASSSDLSTSIQQALADSENLIAICSPNAANSHWVNEEIKQFKQSGKGNRVFCLLVGEPEQSFPASALVDIDGDGRATVEETEPLAADARPDADGKTGAKLKLVAGLLDIGLDELKRRETHRRNRRLSLIVVSSLLGMAITSTLSIVAYMAERRAEAAAATATQTTEFLVGLFSIVDPSEARGNTVTAREILDKGALKIEAELSTQPEVQATLMTTMGTVYKSLGLYPQAKRLLGKSLDIHGAINGEQNTEFVQTRAELADVLSLEGNFDQAVVLFRTSIALQNAIDPSNNLKIAEMKEGLAETLTELGRYDDARPLLEEVLALRQAELGASHQLVAASLESLGFNYFDRGALDAGEQYLREAVLMFDDVMADIQHPDRANAHSNLAYILISVGNNAEAEQYFKSSLDMFRKLYGDEHPTLATGMSNMSFVLREQEKFAEAEAYMGEAAEMNRKLLGDSHPVVAAAMLNLAALRYDMGAADEAVTTIEESITLYRRIFPQGHPDLVRALTNLGGWQTEMGERQAAMQQLTEALEIGQRILGEDHFGLAFPLATIAALHVEDGEFQLARERASSAGTLFADNLAEDHWRVAWATSIEGAAHAGLGNYETAERMLRDSYEILQNHPNARQNAVSNASRYITDLEQALADSPQKARVSGG